MVVLVLVGCLEGEAASGEEGSLLFGDNLLGLDLVGEVFVGDLLGDVLFGLELGLEEVIEELGLEEVIEKLGLEGLEVIMVSQGGGVKLDNEWVECYCHKIELLSLPIISNYYSLLIINTHSLSFTNIYCK